MKNTTDLLSFIEQFSTEDKCYAFLVNAKWGKGYTCIKCGHNECIKGRTWHHKRCRKCNYDESCTANTLFHRLRFPLTKAFVIIYQLSTMKKGMSTCEIARQHGIHQESAWFFKRKVQLAMQASDTGLLKVIVEADETLIGGFEAGAQGRSHGKKKSIFITVEIGAYVGKLKRSQMLRAKAVCIDNYSIEALADGINETISEDAIVVTDRWGSYIKAVGERKHLDILSDKGKSMPEIHRLIFNLKNWLRGTHHNVSADHLQCYLDEFFFRFNYRNAIQTLPNKMISAMIKHSKTPYISLVA